MTTVLSVQQRLAALGFDPGPRDGLVGPRTLDAVLALANAFDAANGRKPAPNPPQIEDIHLPEWPAEWMPFARMDRIIVHWTAGGPKASALDRKHYHFIINDDGAVIRGDHKVSANAAPIRGNYAAHTLNCNTGSIGVALAGMLGAVESPFNAGPHPVTARQWTTLAALCARLARRYAIPVSRSTILSHAEVQGTLGIRQRGKWDIARLPFAPELVGAEACGHDLRRRTAEIMH